MALTFSSTIIVVKLLSEKRDLQTLYGRLAVGIFLTQDVISILLLIGLSTFSGGSVYGSLPVWQNIVMVLVRALILVLVTMWLSAKVFPKVLKYIGGNDELLLIFALAWALGLAAFVSLPFMGFSLEIGGFLAGLSLAQSGVHYEISSRIKSIRDFFIIIFFVVLGSGLVLTHASTLIWPAIILSLFVLIGNPLIIMILLGSLGYKPRTSFFTGVTVAQISEFSLILVALGYQMNFLQSSDVGLVTLIGIITIALSSYMIKYAGWIYDRLKFILVIFDFRKGAAEKNLAVGTSLKGHIVLVGAHRLGHHLIDALIKQKRPFVIVDFNPEVVEKYVEQGLLAICGDITDSYIQEEAHLRDAKLIVSTIPDYNSNLALLEAVQKFKRIGRAKPKLIFIAQDEAEIKALYARDIDYVISPHFMGGLHLAKILEDDQNFRGLKKLREHHLKLLR
jgi:Kef-type K+ transport system membrane component KefB